MNVLLFISWVFIFTGCLCGNNPKNLSSINKHIRRVKKCFPIYDFLTTTASYTTNEVNSTDLINSTVSTTKSYINTTNVTQTTPSAAPWPSNQALRTQISEAILKYGGNLSVSEYQGLMDTSRDLNTFMQYWNATQMSILTPIIGQAIVSQASIHNSSTPITSMTYDADVVQNIVQALHTNAPNMSPDDIQFVINTLQTMSTIAVNALTLDELTQMAQACASAFINNTLINGPVETTTISSTTITSTQAPTTPSAAPWPSNQALRVQISEAILKYGGNLSVSEYQGLMDTSRDLNTFMQYWNATQMSLLTPIIGQAIVSQASIHNSSTPITSMTYDADVVQNIVQALHTNAPNMSPDDIQFVINTLQTMSTIAVNALTLDELTQMAQACASAFINNTLINGPVETTTISSTTISSTYSSTTISVPSITTTTLSPEINQQLTNSISSLAPSLNQTQIQNLLNAIQVLANTYYFTPAQTLVVAPGMSLFFMYHSGSSVTINGTTAVYTAADELSIVTFFNVWIPAMTSADIQNYITSMKAVSYYSQGVTALEALSLAPALSQIFINQASAQTSSP